MKTYKKNLPEITLKKTETNIPCVKIVCSRDAAEYIKQFYFDDIEIFESMYLLILNRANNTIGYVKISQGGTAGTVVDVKLIAKYAVESIASSVILAHNHPSGNIQPSEADKRMTEKVKNALTLFDINVLDHLILTKDSYYSLADENKM